MKAKKAKSFNAITKQIDRLQERFSSLVSEIVVVDIMPKVYGLCDMYSIDFVHLDKSGGFELGFVFPEGDERVKYLDINHHYNFSSPQLPRPPRANGMGWSNMADHRRISKEEKKLIPLEKNLKIMYEILNRETGLGDNNERFIHRCWECRHTIKGDLP